MMPKYEPILDQKPDMGWIDLEKLYVDDAYQRDASGRHSRSLINRIANDWDWKNCQPLTVAHTAYGYAIVDGQHRFEAAYLRKDIDQLPCYIIDAERKNNQAKHFASVNKNRIKITPVALYHSEVVAGDPIALKVMEVLSEVGLNIPTHTNTDMLKDNETCAVNTLKNLARNDLKKKYLTQALKIIVATDPECGNYLRNMMIKAITGLVELNLGKPEFKPERLTAAIEQKAPTEWEEAARLYRKTIGGVSALEAFYALLAKEYNQGIRSGKLYIGRE